MSILVVYTAAPKFPPTAQQPGAQRAQIGGYWVDYLGAVPTLAEVQATIAPAATIASQLDTFGGRAKAAAVLKQSTQWASMTAPQQARIQAVIDAEAAAIITAIQGLTS